MITSIDIYSQVTDYIEHNITLRELESWLVFMLPMYLSNPDSDAAMLASRVELGLAEINAGITTERLLRKQLRQQFIHTPIKSQSYPFQTSNEGSTTTSMVDVPNLEWMNPSPSWSSAPLVVSV